MKMWLKRKDIHDTTKVHAQQKKNLNKNTIIAIFHIKVTVRPSM